MKYSVSVLFVLTISFSFIISCEETDPEVANPTITLVSSEATTSIGSTVSITANIADLPAVFALSMRISFDSNRLTINDSQTNWIGNLWSSSAIGLLEVESGVAYLSISQIAGSGNVSGDGTIMKLEITAEQVGVASLNLIQSQLIFYDESGAEITMSDLELEGASITIE